jgi:hypothetical protein
MTQLDVLTIVQFIVAIPVIILAVPLLFAHAFLFFVLPHGLLIDPATFILSWIVVFLLVIAVVPALRRKRVWRWIGGIVGASLIGTAALTVVNQNLRKSLEATYQQEVARHTFHLDARRSFDSIDFPVGSTVVLSVRPPHHLVRAEVPTPTTVLGLNVIGGFWMHPPPAADPSAPPRDIWKGTLGSSATIRGVPCGPGPFENTGSEGWFEQPLHPYYNPASNDPDDDRPSSSAANMVSCTLGRNFTISGATLRAGTNVDIRLNSDGKEPFFSGTLEEPTILNAVSCARGPIVHDENNIECISSGHQTVQGLTFADGHELRVDNNPLTKEISLRGTLAGPRIISDLPLPAETEVDLRSRSSSGVMSSLIIERMTLPADAAIKIEGAVVQGRMLVSFYEENGRQHVLASCARQDSCTIRFEGHEHRSGEFDGSRWNFDD